MLQCLEKIQEDAYHIVAREVVKTLLYFLNFCNIWETHKSSGEKTDCEDVKSLLLRK